MSLQRGRRDMACRHERQVAVSDGVTSVASVARNLDFEASVGAVTDTGPRPVNADRFYTSHSPADGSWVIAVADGVGGHPEAADAAAAAVEGLPDRIDSLEAMRDAFVAASDRVLALAPSWDDFIAQERADFGDDRLFDLLEARTVGGSPYRHLASCPLCTLCVAAWTPTGGLLVASMGDTLAFEVRWPTAGALWRRLVAEPHRDPPLARGVTSYLGAHPKHNLIVPERSDDPYYRQQLTEHNRYFAAVEVDLPADPATSVAVIVASDGAWEPLWKVIYAAVYAAADPETRDMRYRVPVVLPDDWTAAAIDPDEEPVPPLYFVHSGVDHGELAHAVASVAGSNEPAANIAGRVLDAARTLGLEDNATVAAAVMSTPLVDP